MRTSLKRHWFLSLRFGLFLLVIIAAVPALGLLVFTTTEQQRLATSQARENALKLTRSSAASQEQMLEGGRHLLTALAQLSPVQGQDPPGCISVFTRLLSQYPSYANLGAIDRDGNVFCSVLPLPATPINVRDRGYFHNSLETHIFSVGEYQQSRLTGKPVLTLAQPVLNDAGRVTAVVFAGLDLTWLNTHDAGQSLPEGAILTVADHAGTVLVRSPEWSTWISKPMPEVRVREAMLAQDEGWLEHVNVDGRAYLFAYTRVGSTAGVVMHVAVGLPEEIAFAESSQIATRNYLALGLVAALTLALGRTGSNWFVLRGVDALLAMTRRLTAGDLSARTGLGYGKGELGTLAKALDQMAETLQQREAERKRMDRALVASARRSEALAAAAGRLNAQLLLKDVLHAICEEATRALNVSAASVSLYDAAQDLLCPAASHGLPAELKERLRPVARGDVYDRLALTTGAPLVFADGEECCFLADAGASRALKARTTASAGMLRDGKLVGVLCIYALDAPHQFTGDEMRLLKGLTDLAAQAITNARLYDVLKQEEQARARLLHQTITAQEDERMRIARELHDETSQSLSALMLGLDTVGLALTAGVERTHERLEATRAIAGGLLGNIHRLIANLRPSLLDQMGLVPAITWYGEQRLGPLGIALHLEENLEARLAPAMETSLFRIVQEAITNIIRHAQATEVTISLIRRSHLVVLRITDNGRGFDPAGLHPSELGDRGWGLRGIQERVSILGGEFTLQTAPGQGTTLKVRVPVPEGEENDDQD